MRKVANQSIPLPSVRCVFKGKRKVRLLASSPLSPCLSVRGPFGICHVCPSIHPPIAREREGGKNIKASLRLDRNGAVAEDSKLILDRARENVCLSPAFLYG